jgi:hypothetical protein
MGSRPCVPYKRVKARWRGAASTPTGNVEAWVSVCSPFVERLTHLVLSPVPPFFVFLLCLLPGLSAMLPLGPGRDMIQGSSGRRASAYWAGIMTLERRGPPHRRVDARASSWTFSEDNTPRPYLSTGPTHGRPQLSTL